jgi:hypothetical protein
MPISLLSLGNSADVSGEPRDLGALFNKRSKTRLCFEELPYRMPPNVSARR